MKQSLSFLLLVFLVSSSCQQIKQMVNFTQCEFRTQSVENTNLAGVNVQQIQRVSDLSFLDAGKLVTAYARGTMPLSMTLNLDVKNPNASTAAMNSLEWILLIEDKELVNGVVNDRVSIAPGGGTVTMPIRINADLRKIMAKNSRDENLNMAFGLVGEGNKPSKKLSIKVKPSIMIGSAVIRYPGYITVGTNFGTGSN
ncbi:MAG: hypothetical protein H7Y04_10210 [Verrucomicrobia bacterium]|nr:hypothetical protein [Cytophagales bacterium]